MKKEDIMKILSEYKQSKNNLVAVNKKLLVEIEELLKMGSDPEPNLVIREYNCDSCNRVFHTRYDNDPSLCPICKSTDVHLEYYVDAFCINKRPSEELEENDLGTTDDYK